MLHAIENEKENNIPSLIFKSSMAMENLTHLTTLIQLTLEFMHILRDLLSACTFLFRVRTPKYLTSAVVSKV